MDNDCVFLLVQNESVVAESCFHETQCVIAQALYPVLLGFSPHYGMSIHTQFRVHFHPRYYVRRYRQRPLYRDNLYLSVSGALGEVIALLTLIPYSLRTRLIVMPSVFPWPLGFRIHRYTPITTKHFGLVRQLIYR